MSRHTLKSIRTRLVLPLVVGLFTATAPVHAAHTEGVINTSYDGVAIKGYDPVAYFTDGNAVQGSSDYTYEWLHTKWQFASAEHRDLFANDPLTYVPQYGGYCADAVTSTTRRTSTRPPGASSITGCTSSIPKKARPNGPRMNTRSRRRILSGRR